VSYSALQATWHAMQPMHRRISTTMANRRLCDWPAACDETLLVSLIGLSPEEDVIFNGYTLTTANSATYVPPLETKQIYRLSLEKAHEKMNLKHTTVTKT